MTPTDQMNEAAVVTADEYRAAVRREKQMPAEKVRLIQWLHQTFGNRLCAEYRFHPVRKWRFDWAVPDLKCAIEYDGLHGGLAHKSTGMVMKDSEKMNEAAILGWIVIRVNHNSLKDGSGYSMIERAVAARREAA